MTNPVADLPIPADPDAERCALGAALIDERALTTVMERLRASDFYDRACATVYRAVSELWRAGKSVDLVTLCEKLRSAGELEEIGGPRFLIGLTNYLPTAANVESYVQIVAEKAVRRRMMAAARRIGVLAVDEDGELQEQVAEAEAALFGAIKTRGDSAPVQLASAMDDLWGPLASDDAPPRRVMTGFPSLDKATGGIFPGDMAVLGARPSLGKSTLALQIGLSASAAGRKVLLFTLEMSDRRLMTRLMSALASVSSIAIMRRSVTQSQWERGRKLIESFRRRPMWIDDTPGLTTWDARAIALRHKLEHGLDLVIVDYLDQLCDPKRSGETNNERVAGMVRNLKTLARELDVALLLVAQLSRYIEHRSDQRPALSDFRDSGAIEMMADMVWFLWRESRTNRVVLSVAKHRMFGTGRVSGIRWDAKRAWFEDDESSVAADPDTDPEAQRRLG